MDLDEFGRLISRFESGEKFTRQQILDLLSSCKMLIKQLEVHASEYEGMGAIVETLREKLEIVSHELLIQHEMNVMLSTVVRAMQNVFSEN
jgi:hypothetical protein